MAAGEAFVSILKTPPIVSFNKLWMKSVRTIVGSYHSVLIFLNGCTHLTEDSHFVVFVDIFLRGASLPAYPCPSSTSHIPSL